MAMQWLSLSEAAELLGVHPSTVRNWSDQGVLPVHRTSGGHRRYLRSEVDLWLQAQREAGRLEGNAQSLVQNAVRTVRFQISEGRLKEEAWYNKLDEEARHQYRMSGRGLVQGLITYLASPNGTDARSEAQALGYEYAARGRRYGLSSAEATRAFLFFRNVLIESLLEGYKDAAVQSPSAWSEMYRRITDFTDQILLTLIDTFETYQRANL